MTDFTPLTSLLGGIVIGGAAGLLWLASGQIAGISGIVASSLRRLDATHRWRLLFVGGMLTSALLVRALWPAAFDLSGLPGLAPTVVAGLLVGAGTRLGNGCTSGHGVCGLARGSRRSLVATLTFMATGMLTVLALNLLGRTT